MPDDSLRLAVLVDADNASAAVIGDILSEVASLGTASVKRVYGDFTTSNLHSWRAVLLEHAIQPVQQFRNTIGKNASDSALIIDAMDLLHTRELGGFCLVSSDSDFTRLATRIREDGLPVYGFGEEKTPRSFINAIEAGAVGKIDAAVWRRLVGQRRAPGWHEIGVMSRKVRPDLLDRRIEAIQPTGTGKQPIIAEMDCIDRVSSPVSTLVPTRLCRARWPRRATLASRMQPLRSRR